MVKPETHVKLGRVRVLRVAFIAAKKVRDVTFVCTDLKEGKRRRSGRDAYTLRSNRLRFQSVDYIMPERKRTHHARPVCMRL